MPATTPAGLASVVGHLIEGRSFALASFVFVLYDYLITLDSEIRHVWSGPWTISRALFLCNRYFPLAILSFRLLADFCPERFPSQVSSDTICTAPSLTSISSVVFLTHALVDCNDTDDYLPLSCNFALWINFPLNLAALSIIQGILVIRLWYLFTHSKVAQRVLLASYLVCTTASAINLGLSFPMLHSTRVEVTELHGSYCADPPPAPLWVVFVPSFVLHGVFSAFMIARIVHNLRVSANVSLAKRLAKDGGFLYMVIFFSVSFSISGAIVGVSPSIGVVAMFANFMLALLSICVSRVILHISALAQSYSSNPYTKDPILLLQTAKLGRKSWVEKMGVLVFVPPDDEDEDDATSSVLDDVYY